MDESTVPRPRTVRLDGLGLSSTEAFVLSQIDGSATLDDVADATGVPIDTVLTIARRLEQLGAIERPSAGSRPTTSGRYGGVTSPRSGKSLRPGGPELGAPSKRSVPRRSSRKLAAAAPISDTKQSRPSSAKLRATKRAPSKADHVAVPRHPVLDGAKVPQASLPPAAPRKDDQTCDLDAASIAKIDAAAAAVAESRTHYAILGVPPGASVQEVSRAYFALAAALHPDRYFGKRLGAYKKKLEHAFRTVSEAYEVLRSPSRRLEYDGYLRLTRKSVEMEAVLARPMSTPSLPPPTSTSPPTSPPPPLSPPPPAPRIAISVAPVRPSPSIPPATIVILPQTPPPSTPSARPPARSVPRTSSQPPGSLRRLVSTAKSASLLEEAQQALAKRDAATAANLYRLALTYAEDPASRAYAQSGLNEALSIVADTHVTRARYEEKESRWSDAVASYSRALDRRPDDPTMCERLANALRHEGQDLVRATRLAETAVSRSPRNSAFRKTLGLVYADAGLRQKAIEELEKAAEIDPSDEATTRALAAVRKQRR